MKSAESAMYLAKESGKNKFIIYDESLKPKSTERWLIEQDMREAIVRASSSCTTNP